MKFQKTTEYAIRVMVFLAKNCARRYSVNRLHTSLNIPNKYLGRLMSLLNQAGLVSVQQGKQGGYRINGQRSPIYLYEIIGVVEGLQNYDRCILGFDECSTENPCSLHQYWLIYKERLKDMIFNIDLEDLQTTPQVKH
jgi:Rrf2 family iron-sulfur cluster assembly transcriptional regulator